MLTNLILSALVWGPSECPSPAQIDATLSREVGRQLVVEVTQATDGIHLEARDLAGQPLAYRVLPTQCDCEALAGQVSTVIAAWSQDALTPRAVGHTGVLRRPLIAEAAAPVAVESGPPAPSREWAFSGGAVMGSPPKSFTGTVDFIMKWSGAPLLASSVTFTAPVSVFYATHGIERTSVRLSLSSGPGARATFAGFNLDLFAAMPVSLLVPPDARAAPLQPPLSPLVMVSAMAGLRLTARELRFAPFLRAAVELPLVSFPERTVAPLELSLSFGIAWGAS
jgi:hypothetical protein